MNLASALNSRSSAWPGLFGHNGVSPWNLFSGAQDESSRANGRDWRACPWPNKSCGMPRDRVELSPARSKDTESADGNPDTASLQETQYTYKKSTRVNVGLKLDFNYSALKQIAQKINDGEVTTEEAIESLIKGHFGLSTAFQVSGKEIVEEGTDPNSAVKSTVNSLSQSASSSRSVVQASGDGYSFKIADRETEFTRERMQQVIREGFSRTVRSFDMRYTRDASFDYSHFSRFLQQTSDISDVDPQNLEGYVTSAGALVDSSSNQSLSDFFDVVDKYLSGSQDDMLAAADKFLNDLASKLSLPDEWVDSARSQANATIESFFGSVKSSISEVKSIMGMESDIQPAPGDTPGVEQIVSPEDQRASSSINLVA